MHYEKERRGYIYPVRQKIARLYEIRMPDMRGRIQGYTRLLNFSGRQNSGTTQSTSLFPIRPSGDSCASKLQRQAAIPPDPEKTFQARDSARWRYQQSVTRVSERSISRPFTKTAGNCLDRASWGAHIKGEYHVVLDVQLALN